MNIAAITQPSPPPLTPAETAIRDDFINAIASAWQSGLVSEHAAQAIVTTAARAKARREAEKTLAEDAHKEHPLNG